MAYWKIRYPCKIDDKNPEILLLKGGIDALADALYLLPFAPGVRRRLDKIKIIREIKGTTAIEGNPLSVEDVERVVNNTTSEGLTFEEKEVKNAQEAREYLSELATGENDDITEDLIKEVHKIMTTGVEKEDNVPGSYRKAPAFVGKNDEGIRFEDLSSEMKKLCTFVNSTEARKYGKVVRAFIMHFYFVAIHPFADGNGRTARALEAYLLKKADIKGGGFYALANFYYKNRDRYFTLLHEAKFKHCADLTEFVLFALEGLKEQLMEAYEENVKSLWWTVYSEMLNEFRSMKDISARASALAERIKEKPMPRQKILNKGDLIIEALYEQRSERTIDRELKKLFDLGLLAENEEGLIHANLRIVLQYTPIFD